MNIGILSKRDNNQYFAGKLKKYFEKKRHRVKIYTEEILCINESLLKNDIYILKTRSLFFLYAAYYLKLNKIPVFPDPDISYKTKNRIEAQYLLKDIGLTTPVYYMGSSLSLKERLDPSYFPLILKPIMGSGSRGVKLINTIQELNGDENQTLYLEKYINGTHYNVYFIEDKICPLKKPPLANEHVIMEKIVLTEDVKDIITKWKNRYNLLFGHLDIVREESSNKLYVVDAGLFPQFTNWKCGGDPVIKIGAILLDQISNVQLEKN